MVEHLPCDQMVDGSNPSGAYLNLFFVVLFFWILSFFCHDLPKQDLIYGYHSKSVNYLTFQKGKGAFITSYSEKLDCRGGQGKLKFFSGQKNHADFLRVHAAAISNSAVFIFDMHPWSSLLQALTKRK